MAVQSDAVLQAIIAVSILLLGAKLLAELFAHFHLPVILGELGAGIILGPLYFAGLVQIQPSIIQVNDVVLAFAEIGAIVSFLSPVWRCRFASSSGAEPHPSLQAL